MPSTPLHRALPRRLPVWVGALLALLTGAGVPVQSRLNGELSAQLADPVLAALISLLGSLVIVAVITLTVPTVRRAVREVPRAVRRRDLRPGYLLAGAVGALFVLTQTITVALLGVTVFIVAVVAGQTVGGLVTDAVGFGGHSRRRPTPRRLVGGALVVLAVLLPAVGDPAGSALRVVLPALGVVAVGVLTGFQHAANARIGTTVGSPLGATVVNVTLGTSIVLVVALLRLVGNGPPTALPTEWWLYLGGIFGVVFIAGAAALIPHIGVLVLGLGSIAGQLVISLVLDVVAPVDGTHVSGLKVVGTALALVAVVLATLPPRRRRATVGAPAR